MRHPLARFGAALLLPVLLFATGCTLRVKSACGLNRSLTYVGWAAPDQCGFGACPSNGAATVGSREVRVLPGMQLTFHTTSLVGRDKNSGAGLNGSIPRISKFEWVVPRDRFGPDDYFVISYLLAASKSNASPDDLKILNDLAPPAENRFHETINTQVYAELVKSMRWSPATRGTGELCPAAPLLRQATVEPTREDFMNPREAGSQLVFTLGKTFRFGGGEAAYFNKNVGTAQDPISPWYASDHFQNRVLVTLQIPVRLHGETVSRFVPVQTSVAKLERQLGVEVTGIRRSREFFRDVEIEGRTFGAPREAVISDDDYFTLWFGRWRGWARHERTHGLVARGVKADTLLAPGDVILLKNTRRLRATDDPAVQ